MTWQDIAVGIIVAAAVAQALYSLLHKRKNPCCECGKCKEKHD